MKLKLKRLDLDAGGKTVIILNKEDAGDLGVHPLDRVIVRNGKREITAIVNITERFVQEGQAAAYEEVADELGICNEKEVDVTRRADLPSKKFISKKVNGSKLIEEEIKQIVRDVVCHNLNDLEISAFVTSLHIHGLSMEEIVSLIKAMSGSGKRMNLKKRRIFDKHSLGGCPGDKTTILLVPIVAACGLAIPKTSSRAITSPAGTADRFGVIANVELGMEEMEMVVRKTNGCIVWGGAVDMAPADDLFIRIEYPLGLDPLYIPSIMSKKKSVGATDLVIDIPTGRGTKVKTFGDAYDISEQFISIGKRIGIKTSCGITFGEQPIGFCIGPALEAREALENISKPSCTDLMEKACSLAGILFEMAGKGNKQTAAKILSSGKAEKKLREIIEAQGGNPKIRPSDIEVGAKKFTLRSSRKGVVMWMRNHEIVEIAKLAGAPKDKGAGVMLHAKIGSVLRPGDPVLTIYSEKSVKLEEARKFAMSCEPAVVVKNLKEIMSVNKVDGSKYEKHFILER